MSVDISTLKNSIISDLTTELQETDAAFSSSILSVKVKLAIQDVMMRRNYVVTSMSDNDILNDLNNYYATILNLARYDYNQTGAEGEVSHNENGTSRTYNTRDSLLNGVHSFVKIL